MATTLSKNMETLGYNIGAVAGFLRDLQEEKFPTCARWDEDPRDCHCHHCRIDHYAKLAEQAVSLIETFPKN